RTYSVDAEAMSSVADLASLTYGFEATLDRVSSRAAARDVESGEREEARARFADGSKLDGYALFLQTEVRPHARWTLTAGGRGSWYEIEIPRADREIGVNRTIRDGTGSFGLVHHLTPNVNLVGNVGRAFRVPNVFDLSTLGPRPGDRFNVPSPDLGPESVLGADVGVKVRFERATAELFAFRSRIDDKIRDVPTGETTPEGRTVVLAANLDRVLLYGFEAGLRFWPKEETELFGSLAYTYGEEELPDGREVPADLIPPLQGQIGALSRVLPTLAVDGFVRFAGPQTRLSDEDREDPRIDPNGTDAWFTLNAGLEWQMAPWLATRLRIENLLDRAYREHGSGIDAAGVNVIVALDARY
ncbi:MAG: TonB-dependent receptor, partial [Actinomycetota bacterium]